MIIIMIIIPINISSYNLFVPSGILSCVSVGTVAFTDLPKKKKNKMNNLTLLLSRDLMDSN